MYFKKNLHNEMQMYLTFSLFKLVLFFCIISYTTDVIVFFYTENCWVMVMVFNATFNNISVILWRSVLLVEETGLHTGKTTDMLQVSWQTLSHNVVSSAPHHERDSNSQLSTFSYLTTIDHYVMFCCNERSLYISISLVKQLPSMDLREIILLS
jgi:hypothetical protein